MSVLSLAVRAQPARRRFDQSGRTRRAIELCLGECAVLAFGLWWRA